MFRNTFSGKHANEWSFIIKNAKLDAFMRKEDITVELLSEMAKVSTPTMVAYLKDGKENKAYRNLCNRFPSLMK